MKRGETQIRDLELLNVNYADTDASGSFVMPDGEVTIWSEVDYAYYVTRYTNGLGEFTCDHTKAFPGTLITFTAKITDPTFHNIVWTYFQLPEEAVIIPAAQPNVQLRQFYMPNHDAGMRADFTMPGFPLTLMSCASEPMNSASSSCMILIIICCGFTAVRTFAPMALSFTRLQKSFATL